MLQNLTGWHALIVLAIVVLIFGAAKLPALAKSIGQSMRILKQETSRSDDATTTGPGVTNDRDSVVTRSAPAAPAADSPLPRTS